jgi:hypothetical protein
MSIRFSGILLAVVMTAFAIAPGSAWAQFNVPGFGGSTSSDRMGGGGGGKGATGKAMTPKTGKSKADERMGGGGGAKGAAGRKNLNSSRSN